MDYEDFKFLSAGQLKKLRRDGGLTQEEIADLKISVRAYQKLESGKNGMSLKTIFLLSRRLGVHPGKFFDFPVPWNRPSGGGDKPPSESE